MSRRVMLTTVVGFVIGLLVGMVLIGSSDDLRDSLFGTSSERDKKTDDFTYYLVDLATAQDWLVEEFPEETEKLQGSMTVLNTLPGVSLIGNFEVAEEDVRFILPQAYAALVGVKDQADLEVEPDDTLSVCLGLDEDPYEGAAIYLYVAVPKDQTSDLHIPEGWEKLPEPKTNVLYWQLLGCYPEPAAK